jgi:hypothetical protein
MIMKRHVLICSLLIGTNVINVNALDEEEAVQKAEQYVPEGFEYKEAEQEEIIQKLLELPMCSHRQHYVSGNLNHDVFGLYF